jgi:putative transposase
MYHVTLRGNHRQDIFFTRADHCLLTTIISEVIESCGAQIHAYCYMPNHIHLLMQVDDTPLSKIMLLIASQYARRVQARLETTGHFFERRYHAVLVDTDAYLITLLRYIRLEPWVITAFALRMFDADRERAITAYQAFMACPPTSSPLAECNPRDPRILGSDSFAHKLLGDNWKPQFSTTLQQIVDDGCARFEVTVTELQSASRLEHVVHTRQWITEKAIAAGVASLASLSRYFHRDASNFRHTVQRRRPRA